MQAELRHQRDDLGNLESWSGARNDAVRQLRVKDRNLLGSLSIRTA
jgi:hypothetical protein